MRETPPSDRNTSPERAARDSRDGPEITLSCIGDGVITADASGRVNYLNPVAEHLTGWVLGDAAGKEIAQVFRIVNDETRTPVVQAIRKVIEQGGTVGLGNHTLLIAGDGGERPIDGSAAVINDDRGTVLGVVLVFRDITERRRAERLLDSARAFAESIVTTVREPLLVLDKDLHIVSANRSFYATFKVDPTETDGRFVYDLGNGQWDIPKLRVLLEDIVPANGWFNDFEVEHDFEHIGPKTMLLNARRFPPEGPFELLLLAIEDITDRKQAEEKQRRSKALLVEAQQLAHIGSWNWDLVSGAFHWSDEHYRIFGFEPQAPPITLERAWNRVHSEDRPRVQDLFDRAIRDRQSYECVFRLLLDDGLERIVQSRGRPVLNEAVETVRMFGTIQDVTERMRTEEALRVANERLDLAMRGSSIGIWDLDLAPGGEHRYGPVRFINVWEPLGYDPAEFPMVASASRALGYPDDLPRIDAAVVACLAGETEEIRVENRIRHKDGSYHWLLTLGKAMRDVSGRPVRLIGTVLDITERKRAEEALRESEAKFRALAENVPSLVWSCTLERQCDYVNPQFMRYTGQSEAELLGNWRLDNIHADDHAAMFAAWEQSVAAGRPVEFEARVRRHDGAWRWFQVRAAPIRDEQGQLIKWFGTNTDIDELKRAQEALRHAKEAAESANRAKDEFLANVSHEIRTPFGAILGMTELVLDTPLTEDQRQCLETANSAADSLLLIVDQLLDFAKIEAGKLELAPAAFSLRASLGETMRALAPRAEKKGLELVYHVGPDVPDALVGDAVRLRQVLTNLVGNAIKFTEQGKVGVDVAATGTVAGCGEPTSGPLVATEFVLRFTVRDTGIGIARDKQERIFLAFEQEDTSTTRKYGGTGLGLAIAARLVGLMSGAITVESEPGRGSTFVFTVRLERQPQFPEPSASAPPADAPRQPLALAAPLRILVAEDNELNVRHLERLLTRRGHSVRLAGNGRAALELAQGAAFDVLLLDLHMPELDGLQVIRAIRAREWAAGGHLPVIALTARARPEDREHCLAAGMDDYLTKPVRAAELFAAIERVVRRDEGRAMRDKKQTTSVLDSSLQRGLLDPAVLLAACGDDAEGLRGLCEDFQAFAPGRLGEVQDALHEGDALRLRETAHKLCGLLSAFSTTAATVAADTEEHAAAGRLEDARTLVEQLETMTRELLGQVAGMSLEDLRRRASSAG